MKKKLALIIGGIALIMIIGFAVKNVFSAPGQYDTFAQCLTDKGVTMYGASWCPHCQAQKESFGKSWKKVDYVECAIPNQRGQKQVCVDAGVESYPTWVFPDDTRQAGELRFSQLAERSGCELIQDVK